MFFGLPWYAVVAIVGILIPLGGMFYSFKEKELKMEEKRYTNAKELQELRKMILSLKARVEDLEKQLSKKETTNPSISIDDIEIKEKDDTSAGRPKVRD